MMGGNIVMIEDFERWKRGDICENGGFVIKPKRDFGPSSKEHGWIVTGEHDCNVLPGGTWGRTMEGAIALKNIYVAVGGSPRYEECLKQGPEIGDRFWALVSTFQYYESKVKGT